MKISQYISNVRVLLKVKMLFLCAYTIFMISSCEENATKKVGFLIPDMRSERRIKDLEYFTKKSQELGLKVVSADAKANEEIQYNQALDMINSGIKVLVITPVNANTAAAIVREANKKEVKVIAFDRLIKNAEIDYYISHDYNRVGELIARAMLNLVQNGNYLIFSGDRSDQNAIFINEGQMKVLDPYIADGRIKIVYQSFIEDWSGINSKFEMDRFLRLSNDSADAVLCSNDWIAQGVIEALEEYNYPYNVPVSGHDADLTAIKRILKGKQAMTIYKPLKELAESAAQLSFHLLTGKESGNIVGNNKIFNGRKNVPSVLIDVAAVDSNNIEQTIIKDNFYSPKEIYETSRTW